MSSRFYDEHPEPMPQGRGKGKRDRELRLKEWEVIDVHGIKHTIVAHFFFNNTDEGRGIVFRRRINDNPNNETYIVAGFAQNAFTSYVQTKY